jgi:hypothetical protein
MAEGTIFTLSLFKSVTHKAFTGDPVTHTKCICNTVHESASPPACKVNTLHVTKRSALMRRKARSEFQASGTWLLLIQSSLSDQTLLRSRIDQTDFLKGLCYIFRTINTCPRRSSSCSSHHCNMPANRPRTLHFVNGGSWSLHADGRPWPQCDTTPFVPFVAVPIVKGFTKLL